jgi:hypothetical protein
MKLVRVQASFFPSTNQHHEGCASFGGVSRAWDLYVSLHLFQTYLLCDTSAVIVASEDPKAVRAKIEVVSA